MILRHIRALQVQRDLYAMPRGMERFRAYIETMRDETTGDLALPLTAMNPMGKDHVPTLLDDYLALYAEGVAERAVAGAAGRLRDLAGDFQTLLVIADDLKGGWTNRWASEFSHRFESHAMFKRGWIVGVLWTSEPASIQSVTDALATAIYRAASVARRGDGQTLGEMLDQEGEAMAMAALAGPVLDAEDVEYTRMVVGPLRGATDRATQVACVFGDPAARALGYEPKGLSERAGLALALHDARRT